MNKIIKIAKLIYEYTKYGEEGEAIGKTRAIDEVSLEILWPSWDTMDPASPRWPNI